MEKHLQVVSQALNKANLNGAFTLQESAIIMQAFGALAQELQPAEPTPIEDARKEAQMKVEKSPKRGRPAKNSK